MQQIQNAINQSAAKILLENKDRLTTCLLDLGFGMGYIGNFMTCLDTYSLKDSFIDISNIHVVSNFMDNMALYLKGKIKELFPEVGEMYAIKNLEFVFNGKEVCFILEDPSETTFTSISVVLSGHIGHYHGSIGNMVISLRVDAQDSEMSTMLENTFHNPSDGYYEITGTVEQIFTILSIAKTNL